MKIDRLELRRQRRVQLDSGELVEYLWVVLHEVVDDESAVSDDAPSPTGGLRTWAIVTTGPQWGRQSCFGSA